MAIGLLALLVPSESTSAGKLRQNSAAMLDQPMCKFTRSSLFGALRPSSQTLRITLATQALFAIASLLLPMEMPAQSPKRQDPFGVAWRVIGAWHLQGSQRSVSNGDAIFAGSLLKPAPDTHEHSITILLPDGQRILYECFGKRDCDRGFRVPALYRQPLPIAVELLHRVNAAAPQKFRDLKVEQSTIDPGVPRDEVVAVIGPDHVVEVGGLAAALSSGTYSYMVRSLSRPSAIERQPRRTFQKSGQAIRLTLPSDGLFEVSIADQLNTPRIDLLLGAVRKPSGVEALKSFHDVTALLKDWNEDYQGWPVHDFQRLYLRSLMLGIKPSPSSGENLNAPPKKTHDPDVACEPRFSPAPGVFRSDTEVALQCNTSDATIHYTVDGSQPLNDSPVYRAPIRVKVTALTIKAYATAAGKKDSPVVTGIFRIGD